MGDVVNLRREKKRAARAVKAEAAAENRARFGRTKTEKRSDDAERRKAARVLDGHKLDDEAN